MIKLLVALDHYGITVPEGTILNLGEREEMLIKAGSAEKHNPDENTDESLEKDPDNSSETESEPNDEESCTSGETSETEPNQSSETDVELKSEETPKVQGRAAKIK